MGYSPTGFVIPYDGNRQMDHAEFVQRQALSLAVTAQDALFNEQNEPAVPKQNNPSTSARDPQQENTPYF